MAIYFEQQTGIGQEASRWRFWQGDTWPKHGHCISGVRVAWHWGVDGGGIGQFAEDWA